MIDIIGTELYQWDVQRSVSVTGASHVHFANQGDSKAVIMELTDSQALIPNYLLQTGKQLCVYAVKDGVTIERNTFSVKKRERPENYVYDDDQRNFIYELITEAQEATGVANQAAESARQAKQSADEATNRANTAIEQTVKATNDATVAAGKANEATDRANEAATKATHTAKSLMVVGKTEGTNIALDDAIEMPLVGLRVFGKTIQNGTPTPDAPVDLVSVGDSGSITVNVANGEDEPQSMTVATPNGLPGIRVTSGGNYTDANGQQWICDEIDFARGVYVRRVRSLILDGPGQWGLYSSAPLQSVLHRKDCGQ